MYRTAATMNTTITTPMPIAIHWLVLAVDLMPRRFKTVNSSAKKMAQPKYGISGSTLPAALAHQMVQMIGLSM